MIPIHLTNEAWIGLILVAALGLVVSRALIRRRAGGGRGLGL